MFSHLLVWREAKDSLFSLSMTASPRESGTAQRERERVADAEKTKMPLCLEQNVSPESPIPRMEILEYQRML